MRILFDASAMALTTYHKGGAYRYGVEVARRLPAAMPEGWELELFYNFFRKSHLPGVQHTNEAVGVRKHVLSRLHPKIVRKLGVRAERLAGAHDLFHGPFDRVFPTRRAARVVTIHDLAFLRAPDGLPQDWIDELQRTVPPSARRAHRVITVSEFSKRDIVERLQVPAERVQAIYHGIAPEHRPPEDPQADLARLKDRYGIEPGYLLYLGTLQPNKNIEGLCTAFQILRRRGFEGQLVLAGSQGWLYDEMWQRIVARGDDAGVLQTGFVDDEDIPRLYGNCAAFALVSFLEGFGIPVIEAMACGAPVVAADACSLTEVTSDAGILVDPHDAEQIADALERAATDAGARADLVRRGASHAATFTWEASAAEHAQAYQEALRTRDEEGAA